MNSFYIGSSFLITLLLCGSCVSAASPSSPVGIFYHDTAGFLSTNYYNGQDYAKATDITPPPYFLLNRWYNSSETAPHEFGFGHLLIGFNYIETITYYARGCDNSQSACDSAHVANVLDDLTLYLATFDEWTSTVGTTFAQSTVSFNYQVVGGDASYIPITFSFGHLALTPGTEYVLFFRNSSRSNIQFLSSADSDMAPAVLYRNGVFVRKYGNDALLPLYFDTNENSVGTFRGNVYITVDELLNMDSHWFLSDLSLPPARSFNDAVALPSNSTDFELYFYNNQDTSFTIKDITIFVKAPFALSNFPVVYGEIEIASIDGRTRSTRSTGDRCVANITAPLSTTSFTQVDFTCGNGTIIPANTTYTFRVNTRGWFSAYAAAWPDSVLWFQGAELLYNTPTVYTWVYERNGVYVSGTPIRYQINPFICKHGESRGCNDCKCFRGFDVGYWGGDDCGVCALNFYGDGCNTYCNANKTCHGNGTCNTQGVCACASGFSGRHCESTTITTKRSPNN